jgi:hypothetical protein
MKENSVGPRYLVNPIAPNRAIGSSCLSEMTFVYLAGVEASDGDEAYDCSTRIIPREMNAPWVLDERSRRYLLSSVPKFQRYPAEDFEYIM